MIVLLQLQPWWSDVVIFHPLWRALYPIFLVGLLVKLSNTDSIPTAAHRD